MQPPYPGQQLSRPAAPEEPAAEPPARGMRRWPWILGGVVVAALLASAGAVAGRDDSSTGPAAGGSAGRAAGGSAGRAAGGVREQVTGTPASAGSGIQLTVTSVDCSRTTVGDLFANTTARGTFCIVTLTVQNNTGSAYTPEVTAEDADGIRYGHDRSAEPYVNDDPALFLRSIEPGGRITGQVVFDVPEPARLTRLVLGLAGRPIAGTTLPPG